MDKYPFIELKNNSSSNPSLLNSGFAFYGYDLGKHASFVPWVENHISIFETTPDKIAVSFGFSGCYMAKYSLHGKCYISHIQSGLGDCRQKWNNFYDRNKDSIVLHAIFRPTDCYDYIYQYKRTQISIGVECTIAGVILPDNKCYAVLVNIRTHMPICLREIPSGIRTIPFLTLCRRVASNIYEEDVDCCTC